MKEQLQSGRKKNKVNHCWTLSLVRVLAIILAFNLQGVLLLMLQETSSITNPLYGSNPLILIMVLYPGGKKNLKTILPIRQLLFPAQLASSTCSMLGTPHFKCAPTNTEMLFCDLEPYPCGLKKTKVSKNRK